MLTGVHFEERILLVAYSVVMLLLLVSFNNTAKPCWFLPLLQHTIGCLVATPQ
jgi:hypothetical protein